MTQLNTHSLTWDTSYPNRQSLLDRLEYITELPVSELEAILNGRPDPWHHRQQDLGKLSRDYPQTLFTLEVQGPSVGDLGREYYQDGLVHAVRAEPPAFPAFNEAELGLPRGVGTNSTSNLERTLLPDNDCRCQGADSGFMDLETIHFLDDRDDLEEASSLYYAELDDPEYQISASGFFCESCLRAAGITPEGRTTLFQEIQKRARAACTPPA